MADRGTIEELLIRRALESNPLGRAVSGSAVPLPSVSAPPLDDITVVVEKVDLALDGEVDARVTALTRTLGARRARESGEVVAPGDEVAFNSVGYVQGKILPTSAHFAAQRVLDGRMWIDSVLAGSPVAQTHYVKVAIPAEHPMTSFRGALAVFAVHASKVSELKPLPPESPEFLKKAGKYRSMTALRDKLKTEVEETAGVLLFFKLFRSAMEQILERAPVKVPPALLEKMMAHEWLHSDGAALERLEIPPPDREAALKVWLQEPVLREEMTRKISTSVTLKAIAEKAALRFDQASVTAAVKETAQATGLPIPQARTLLGSPEGEDAAEALAVMAVASYVMSKVKLQAAI